MKPPVKPAPDSQQSTGSTHYLNVKCDPKVAKECQKMVFSSYRLDQYKNPDAFMSQVALVFSQYDNDTLTFATSPLNSNCIQRAHKFPPTLCEISIALDAAKRAVEGHRFVMERESQGFFWDDARVGFYNAKGELYVSEKRHNLPMNSAPRKRVRRGD